MNDVSTGWNGEFNGELVEPGVYSYSFVIRLINGREERFTGTVQLF